MMRITMWTMLAIGVAANDDTIAHNALKTSLDQLFPSSKLDDTGKTAFAHLLENCTVKASPFTSVLDDAVEAANKCMDAINDKEANKNYLTSADSARFKACTMAAVDVYKNHGGLNFLAQPSLSQADIDVLQQCAVSTGDIGKAFGIILNRYTPCELGDGVITAADEAIFKSALESDTRFLGEQRTAFVRQLCNSFHEFEVVHKSVSRFAESSMMSFFDLFTDETERRA